MYISRNVEIDIEAVDLSHLLHALESADLLGDLLSEADMLLAHVSAAAVEEVLLLCVDKVVKSVERYSAVVADDTSSAVGVGQTCDDVAVTRALHLGGVGVKYSLIVGFMVIGKDFYQVLIDCVAVGGSRLNRHLDAAVGHERALEGLVGLKSDDLFQILHALVDITGAVAC